VTNTTTDTKEPDYLLPAYNELCTSYHAIDDFRTKLLGFLPLVTGGGLVLLSGRAEDVQKEFFGPVGTLRHPSHTRTVGLRAVRHQEVPRPDPGGPPTHHRSRPSRHQGDVPLGIARPIASVKIQDEEFAVSAAGLTPR
jgi:hypothetical protein